MPSLFVPTSPFLKSVKTSLLVITSLFVLASSCGIGTHQSILSGGCATCPDNAAGCDTFKPLYMKDYESCVKCVLTETSASTSSTWSSSTLSTWSPSTRWSSSTRWSTSTSSPAMSSLDSIWVTLGAFAALIILGLLFAKYIYPHLFKWYWARHQAPKRGSDKSDPQQILIPSENADENHDQSDSADSNLAQTPFNPGPSTSNTAPTTSNPGPNNVRNSDLDAPEQMSALDSVKNEEDYEEYNERLAQTAETAV